MFDVLFSAYGGEAPVVIHKTGEKRVPGGTRHPGLILAI